MRAFSLLIVLALAATAHAQTLPPAPTPPPPTFAQERDGRRLWLAARDAVRGGRTRMTCQWEEFRSNSRVRSGTEIVAADPDSGRLDWILETAQPERQVRRAVLADERLLTLRFDAAPKPRRTYTLASPGATGLQSLAPRGMVARWALLAPPPPDSRLWRDDDRTLWETPYSRREGAPAWLRRYRFDPKTRALASLEEWTSESAGPRRAAIPVFRREVYTPSVARADLFSQKLPDDYQEQRDERAEPDARGPEIDPAAARLLARWKDAFERPLALQATVAYDTVFEKRTPTSRDYNRRNDSGSLSLWLRRPGRVRVEDPEGRRLTLVVVNGDRAMGRRPTDVRDTESLWNRLRRAGADDQSFLSYFFDGPPDLSQYQRVRSLGRSSLDDGTEVDVIEASRIEGIAPRDDRKQEIETTLLIGIAGDGLPREIQLRSKTTIADLTDTNQPPILVRRVRWRDIARDNETAPDRFAVR